MKNKIVQTFFCVLISFSVFAQDSKPATPQSQGIAVIELFTSQGDINSPPADQLLSTIIAEAEKNNQQVYCLSQHVDFWNRYGWNDPFSSLKYTRRLMNYTSVLGMKETYTPLMILNGKTILPVKDQKKTMETISSELQKSAVCHPTFSYQVFDDTLDISYQLNPVSPKKQFTNSYIHVVIVEKGLETKVTKGDNEGKTLKNDNVTRLLYSTDVKGTKGLVRVPLKKQKAGDKKSIIVFIQDKTSSLVQGASTAAFR